MMRNQDRERRSLHGNLHKNTKEKIALIVEIIEGSAYPMTVRQVFYQFVAKGIMPNTHDAYRQIVDYLTVARQRGFISWDSIEDRTRFPHVVAMWEDLPSFVNSALDQFRLDAWKEQPVYIEFHLEKAAMMSFFLPILRPYGITLNVSKGFDSLSAIYQTSLRLKAHEKPASILYFGDFDPSGEEIFISLKKRLAFFGCQPEFLKCAIDKADIERYNLPPNSAKSKDVRSAKFIEKYGNACVELDALPPEVLADRINKEIQSRIDPAAFNRILKRQKRQAKKLRTALSDL